MSLFKVTDMNGKTFEGEMDNLFKFNGDLVDSAGNILADSSNSGMLDKIHTVDFYDANGNVIDAQQVINDMENGKSTVVGLDVLIEATHSGDNLNYFTYYEDSMENDAVTFMNPFEKPLLKNHNTYSGEPLGRVKMAYCEQSKIVENRAVIMLNVRVTDKEAIPKFLDGRYKTVSISGSPKFVQCQICGKTILKDGNFKFCGHWRGESYKDKKCYWSARDIVYEECSVVNTPADIYAQVVKVTVITASDTTSDSKGKEKNMEETNTTATSDSTSTASVADVMKLLDGLMQATKVPEGTAVIDSLLNGQKPADPASNVTTTVADAATTATTAIADAEKIAAFETEIKDAKEKIELLNSQIVQLTDEKAKADQIIAAQEQENTTLRDNLIAVSKISKELLVDCIIAKEAPEESKVNDRKTELMANTMKSLYDLKDAKSAADTTAAATAVPATPAATTTVTQVTSPVLASDAASHSAAAVTTATEDRKKPAVINEIIAGLAKR